MRFQPINWKNRIVPITALALITTMTIPALADGLMVYHITDGAQEDNVSLFQANVEAAIDQSIFNTEDYYISYLNEENAEYAQVTLKEKFDVAVSENGLTEAVHTGAATAEEIVAAAGIVLDEDDETQPSRDTLIAGETRIEVIRVDTKTRQKNVSVKYDTVYQKTKKLEKGQSKVKQEGENGEAVETYEYIYRNGELSEKKLINTEYQKQPIDKIVLKGTAQPTVKTAGGKLAYTQCLSVEATAYSGGGLTASGAAVGVGKIAVDPSVIPLGTELYITSADGTSWVYGKAVASDTGGAIKGNRIDLYFNSESECERFGRQGALVYILK